MESHHRLPVPRFVLLLLLAALPAVADPAGTPVPIGDEFQVNTYTPGNQGYPAVAADADGDFVVVWSSSGSVQGQRFDSAGAAVGDEFQVNTDTTYGSRFPAVAADADGDFIVVWQRFDSSGWDPSASSIRGQRFDSTGATAGEEFRVNADTAYGAGYPALAAAADGDFVVVWERYIPDDSDPYGSYPHQDNIHGQRFDSTGATVGDEFQVNTFDGYWQSGPAVAADAGGDFVVVWRSYLSSGGDYHSVQGQRFDSTGAPVGDQFQVNTLGWYWHPSPAVAADADGDFVVVWESYDWSGSGSGSSEDLAIPGQRFDSSGSPVGDQFQVNTYTAARQLSPAVAADADGAFLVVWESDGSSGSDSSSWSVQARYFNSSGEPVGNQFQVNTYTTGSQRLPAVAADADGDFVVVWAGVDIQGQRFATDSDGDGVIDAEDRCPGFDDRLDADGDGTPDGCDPCTAGAHLACLLGQGFRVEGVMSDFSSPPRSFDLQVMSFPGGRAESDQAVFFESFSPGNFEIGVKMVDGCSLPEGHPLRHYWAFVGGLTNAATEVVLEDTVTGRRWVWSHSAGSFPQTVGDTSAFPCAAGAPGTPCAQGANTACLLDRRFEVTASMRDFNTPPQLFPGRVMSFPAGRAESDQAVFFESFSPGTFEVGVKMVDGCGLPEGHPLRRYWVFYGGLTNARARIEVTQVATGLVDLWENPAGVFPVSEGRTSAFPCE